MQDQHEITRQLLALCEFVKSTDLSFPNRQTILSLLGAALVINADSSHSSPEQLSTEFKLHLKDALGALGFGVERMPRRRGRPPSVSNKRNLAQSQTPVSTSS
jgi:hypothetical protein